MRRNLPLPLLTLLILGLLVVLGTAGAQSGEQPGRMRGPSCVSVVGIASYRSGYRHVVRVTNACSSTAECEVSTNVDPQPTHHLTVPPGESREQVTRIGSPSYEFEARAECRVAGGSGGGSGGSGD